MSWEAARKIANKIDEMQETYDDKRDKKILDRLDTIIKLLEDKK